MKKFRLLGLAFFTACGAPDGSPLADVVSNVEPTEAGPMTALDEDEYQLRDSNEWTTQYLRLAVLAQKSMRRTLDEVIDDANHDGTRISSVANVSCFHTGFTFDDDQSSCWRPQGITGSADGYPEASGLTPAGRKVLAVSWHDDECGWSGDQIRGSRITLIDVTSMSAIRYRRVLLVEPCETGGLTDVCPVNVHAGGIAWAGNYLYLVDTNRGLRVFDLNYMLQVNTTHAAAATTLGVSGSVIYAFDYKYVLPQVGRYEITGVADPNYSWISLDRSSTPASLITGEYASDYGGRVLRWDLAANNRLVTSSAVATAREARYIAQKRVQGGFSRRIAGATKYRFVGSPNSDSDRLYWKTATDEQPQFIPFASQGTPQNLHYSPFSDNLWSLDEFNTRPVFACKLASVD